MQEHKLPPLPNQKRKQIDNKLLNIIKVASQQPYNCSVELRRSHTQNCQSTVIVRSNSISNSNQQHTTRSTSASKDKMTNQSLKKYKINSSHQLFNDGSAYLKLPKVTAKSWILYEMKQQRCLYGLRHFKRRQIASLTKMLNLITILNLLEELNLDPSKIKARATHRASTVIGTTAQLKQNTLYCLEDLYYGMMLPSGNDAATMVAEIGGCLLKANSNSNTDWNKMYEDDYLSSLIKKQGASAIGGYLREMNRLGKQIGMVNTNLVNPHGLSNISSFSTANDLAKLCTFAMRNQIFRKVVNTKKYNYLCQPSSSIQEEDKENINPNASLQNDEKGSKEKTWENTNKMLGQGWSGIKTGITPNAGPCLAASCLKTIAGRQYQFLIILLSSQSMQARWAEVRALVSWVSECKLYQ